VLANVAGVELIKPLASFKNEIPKGLFIELFVLLPIGEH